jgi:acyl-CoA thioesterase
VDRRQLFTYFEADRFVKGIGIQIEHADENEAACSLLVNENHLNADNVVQGGVLFTLADFAFAVAANAGGRHTVTISSSISYIRACKQGMLTAIARATHNGNRICVYSVEGWDENGVLLAQATITGYRNTEKAKEFDKLP